MLVIEIVKKVFAHLNNALQNFLHERRSASVKEILMSTCKNRSVANWKTSKQETEIAKRS